MAAVRDPASATDADSYVCSHVHLHAVVDPSTRIWAGSARLSLRIRKPAHEWREPGVIVLDTHPSLTIVSARAHWHPTGHASASSSSAATAHHEFPATTATPVPVTSQPFTGFGNALHVDVSSILGDPAAPLDHAAVLTLTFHYVTGTGPSTCWLTPLQTAGKLHPFLFTQGQACLNRSLFPCQDSPGVRSTYSAHIITPRPLVALASAHLKNAITDDGRPVGVNVSTADIQALGELIEQAVPNVAVRPEDYHAFSFDMPHSIPIYLAAFIVADVACAEIGPRSRVWAEPPLLAAAAYEFGHGSVTEKYIATGERLFGPYRWGRYDIAVLPPAFPYGGMENPCLTFVTPTLLAGDQSLTDVVCHEIAHSWFGNLVTNSSWEVFFLNEGATMYAQRRISAEVHSVPFTALETITSRELLRSDIRDLGATHELTRLTVPIAHGVDPDETYTQVPYEKGFAFFSYLRAAVGNDTDFDAWLRSYCDEFAFTCVTPVDMLDSFCRRFPALAGSSWNKQEFAAHLAEAGSGFWHVESAPPEDLDVSAVLPAYNPADANVAEGGKSGLAYRAGYEFARWLHAPGWPVYFPSVAAARVLTGPAEDLAAAWLATANVAGAPADHTIHEPDVASVPHGSFVTWPTFQKMHFLDTLLVAAERAQPGRLVTAGLFAGLEVAYAFSTSRNAELRLRYSQLVVAAWPQGFPSVLDFLSSQGKQKFTYPIYVAMLTGPAHRGDGAPTAGADAAALRNLAVQAFTATRLQLHVNVVTKVAKLLAAHGVTVPA